MILEITVRSGNDVQETFELTVWVRDEDWKERINEERERFPEDLKAKSDEEISKFMIDRVLTFHMETGDV